MEPRTVAHLLTAERNRVVAERLLGSNEGGPPSAEWATVVAFYSAVHLVNAYLWERFRIEPHNHQERSRFVAMTSDMRHFYGSYRRLRSLAFQARYEPEFRVSADTAGDLLYSDLAAVGSAVRAAFETA